MFLGFAEAIMGDQFNLPPPPGLADGTQLGQLLEDAHFVDVMRIDYQHNLDFGAMQDAVRFMAGPHSQFAPMLNKLKASGRSDIYPEAAKVSIGMDTVSERKCSCPALWLVPCVRLKYMLLLDRPHVLQKDCFFVLTRCFAG